MVIVSDSAAGESHLYINGVLSGHWAGSIPLSGQVKVMGARLEQATDHMGGGSTMHAWATYAGQLTAAEVASLYGSRPEVVQAGAISSVALSGGNVVIDHWNAQECFQCDRSLQRSGRCQLALLGVAHQGC